MKPIFWQRELVRPVENWDRLDFADCEGLLRGLYRSVGMVTAADEHVVHHRAGTVAWVPVAAQGAANMGMTSMPVSPV